MCIRDRHEVPLRFGVSCWLGIDPTLTAFKRKAIAAMVNIDASDGAICAVCSGPIASRLAPTNRFTVGASLLAMAACGAPPPILKPRVLGVGHFARYTLQEVAILSLRSLVIAVLVVLAGCATPPRAPVEVAPVIVSESTWQQVDREIVAASQSATEQTRIYARGAMDYWRTRVYELTEQNFIPWFSNYWTQEWLSVKVSWYNLSAKGEQDASEKRLAAYLLEAYQEKVLAPVAREVDPDSILSLAAAFYVDILKEELQKISTRHGVPMAQLNGRIQKIPVSYTHLTLPTSDLV